MGSIRTTAEQFSESSFFLTSYLSPNALKVQLSYWTEELGFYQQLLAWGLFGCPEEAKAGLRASLAELSSFQEEELPRFRSDLENLDNQVPQAEFLLRFQEVREQLKQLKQRIFQHAQHLVNVRVW